MPIISNPTHAHSSHLAAPLSQALNTTNLSSTSLFQVLMHCHWPPLTALLNYSLMVSWPRLTSWPYGVIQPHCFVCLASRP